MATLSMVIPNLVKSVSAVCIGRDPLTSTSRGLCYLGTESTIDALAIHGALNNLKAPLTIDGKTGKQTCVSMLLLCVEVKMVKPIVIIFLLI